MSIHSIDGDELNATDLQSSPVSSLTSPHEYRTLGAKGVPARYDTAVYLHFLGDRLTD